MIRKNQYLDKGTMIKRIIIFILIMGIISTFPLEVSAKSKLSKPKFSCKNNVVTKSTKVYLKTKDRTANIYYTIDGTIPQKGKDGTKKYTSKGITIKKSSLIKARSYKKGKYSTVSKLIVTVLQPAKIDKIGIWNKYVKLGWKTDKYVDGYYIYGKSSSSKKWNRIKKIKGAKNNSYTDMNVKGGESYSYQIIPYRGKKTANRKVVKQIKTIVVNCDHKIESVSEGYYNVERCIICEEEMKRYLSLDIPSYWDQEIVDSLTRAHSQSGLPCYVYLTDSHWLTNAHLSPNIINFISRHLGNPLIVFGGDALYDKQNTVEGVKNEILDFYSRFSTRTFSTTGNHDFNKYNYNPETLLSSADLFPIMYQREAAYACLDGGSDYSYYDDRQNRVRMISFLYDDGKAVPDDTIEWIRQRVKELPEQWTVVLFSHAYWTYKDRGINLEPRVNGQKLAAQLLNIQNESRATIALWHVGHVHRDYSEEISNGMSKIRVVSTGTDNYKLSYNLGGPQMIKGTSSEQLIDIVQIDTNNRKIYFIRVGAGEDRVYVY